MQLGQISAQYFHETYFFFLLEMFTK